MENEVEREREREVRIDKKKTIFSFFKKKQCIRKSTDYNITKKNIIE